jgi:ketosteroid isomerase-like protein
VALRDHNETMRLIWEAFGRGDTEFLKSVSHSDIVIIQPPEVPDSKSYRGRAGITQSLEDWPKQWEDFRLEVGEIRGLNDGQVLCVTKQHGRGRVSGIELDFEVAFVHTFRDEKLARLEMFASRDQAIAAADSVR